MLLSRRSTLLAEDCVGVAVRGSSSPEVLAEADALELMAAEPARNMDREERAFEVAESLEALPMLAPAFDELARDRAVVSNESDERNFQRHGQRQCAAGPQWL